MCGHDGRKIGKEGKTDGLCSGAQLSCPYPGPGSSHPCRRLPTSSGALAFLVKGSWVLVRGGCVLLWSPLDCGLFVNLEETVPDAPAAPGQCLHAPPSHPDSAHLRRTCPGRIQRRSKERVAGTRVVILQGPWSPLSAWLPR